MKQVQKHFEKMMVCRDGYVLMSFMPISYVTISLPISLAAVVNVTNEMGINDISTYPSLHTHHFLKMFLDLLIY